MDELMKFLLVGWLATNAGFLFGALWASRDKDYRGDFSRILTR